jgi:hypothetical protein
VARPRSRTRKRVDRRIRIAARAAQVTFFLILLIHLSTYLPFFPRGINGATSFVFFPVIFVLFGAAMMHLNRAIYGDPFGFGRWRLDRGERRTAADRWLRLFVQHVPMWLLVLFLALMALSALTSSIGPGAELRSSLAIFLVMSGLPALYFSYVAPHAIPIGTKACRRCGASGAETDHFCRQCGQRLDQEDR